MQMFAHSATAFGGLAARVWFFYGHRFGKWGEDRISKMSIRDGESAMVGNFDCVHIDSRFLEFCGMGQPSLYKKEHSVFDKQTRSYALFFYSAV